MITLREAIDLTLPFVSKDETRPHLTRPARHAGHVVATDGHTLAAVRYDGNGSDRARTWEPGDCAVPPWEYVTPAAPRFRGTWDTRAFSCAALDAVPKSWNAHVSFAYGKATLTAGLSRKVSRINCRELRPAVPMIVGLPLAGFDLPDLEVTIALPYLLRARDLVDAPVVSVYADGPLDPVVFAASGAACTKADLMALDRFAIVMPMRV